MEAAVGRQVSVAALAAELRRCGNMKGLVEGKLVHSKMVEIGLCDETFLCNLLVQMYGKCTSVKDAKAVFDRIPLKNVYSWSLMITAYAQNGHLSHALKLFREMDLSGCTPDECCFLAVLGVCSRLGSLRDGIELHKCAAFMGFESCVMVGTAIADMYSKCGRVESARLVFDRMEEKDVILWTAMIVAYAQQGDGHQALDLLRRMDLEGTKPDKYVFGGALAACGALRDLHQGKAMHSRAAAHGLQSDVILATGLCNMYAKCSCLAEARKVFDGMKFKDLVSWNAMLAAYAQEGQNHQTLELYREMKTAASVPPDDCTYVTVLGSCSALRSLDKLKEIHRDVTYAGFVNDDAVVIALVDAYARCGSLSDASEVFMATGSSHLVAWNAMMSAYAQYGHNHSVIELLHRMDLEGVKPSEVTFVSALSACAELPDSGQGRQLHQRVLAAGFRIFEGGSGGVLATAVVNVFAKCGRLVEALEVFERMQLRDTVAWNAMIGACAQLGEQGRAVEFLCRMNLEGGVVDETTLLIVLNGCSHLGMMSVARECYLYMEEDYGIRQTMEHSACIVDGLGRAGRLEEAEYVARRIQRVDYVAWSSLLGAFKTHGSLHRATDVVKQVVEKLESVGEARALDDEKLPVTKEFHRNVNKIPVIRC